ncbi:MAG: hypothetical protein JM58_18390 [Peptococcaceae bacterium BICA1-8]|nr:MAG: hypothetical protein JM58_18390 [Peptococcaceae bacterium BICA1-8]
MDKNQLKKILLDILFGLGFILIISPIVLYWVIHGDYERYIWIINGTYPFSNFGGGPFQLFLYLILFLVGVGMVFISRFLKSQHHQ